MNIYKFYNELGWKEKNKVFKDAELFEDLRDGSKSYVSKCRKKLLKYIPKKGNHILDFASGPIQYKEYLEYSKNFKLRHCVDFSKTAIREAKKKIKQWQKHISVVYSTANRPLRRSSRPCKSFITEDTGTS